MFTLCFVLALVAYASGYHLGADEMETRSDSILKFMSNGNQNVGAKKTQLVNFSFNNCADPKTEIAPLSNVQISPDPIKLPGVAKVSGNIAIKSQFGAPLQAKLDVWEKNQETKSWDYIECRGSLGSCTYSGLCNLMAEIDCPDALKKLGFNCKCPFPAGNFTIQQLEVPLEKFPIPVNGEFKIKATVTSGDKLVTCAQVDINIVD
ncbi:ganglioside GM2 activator-like isoform X3 [Physella acuta]|uniref:ganglioside GM2 activator-like isoform X3 n=1 Tax=Physella acuta TaxID=109671 RepID=UPI0027DCE4B0|nr:ganglioside GM2 activator-like isoform X3 [Physella acuta]